VGGGDPACSFTAVVTGSQSTPLRNENFGFQKWNFGTSLKILLKIKTAEHCSKPTGQNKLHWSEGGDEIRKIATGLEGKG